MKNYYEILGVNEKAELKEIKKSYHNLAAQFHPDKHQGKETLASAEEKFKEISEAYSILSDPTRKQEYDQMRSGGGLFGFHTTGDPFDIFFRQSQAQAQEHQRRLREQVLPGRDIVLDTNLSLYDALFGTERPFEYKVPSACLGCKGRGADDFVQCQSCQGSGLSSQRQGNVFMSRTCPTCGGAGSSPKNVCSECSGQRLVSDNRKLSVKFPPGLSPGQVLRVSGGGGRGINDGPLGNLFIKISVSYPDLSKLTEEEKTSLSELLTKSST